MWREEHKGRINTNKARRETVTVVWLCRKNEWDKDTEKGARYKIEDMGLPNTSYCNKDEKSFKK